MQNHHYKLYKRNDACNSFKNAFIIVHKNNDIEEGYDVVDYTVISHSKISAQVSVKDLGNKKEYFLRFYNMDSTVHLKAFIRALWYTFNLNFFEFQSVERKISSEYLLYIKNNGVKITKGL